MTRKDTGTLVNNRTFIFTADRAFGFPVIYVRTLGLYKIGHPVGVCKSKLKLSKQIETISVHQELVSS